MILNNNLTGKIFKGYQCTVFSYHKNTLMPTKTVVVKTVPISNKYKRKLLSTLGLKPDLELYNLIYTGKIYDTFIVPIPDLYKHGYMKQNCVEEPKTRKKEKEIEL